MRPVTSADVTVTPEVAALVEQIMGITVEVNAEISLHLLMDRHRSISEAKLVMEGAGGEVSWG